jgi:hypothetical protein
MNWAGDLRGLPRLEVKPCVLLMTCPAEGGQPEQIIPLPPNATVRTIEKALRDAGWSISAAKRDAGLVKMRAVLRL